MPNDVSNGTVSVQDRASRNSEDEPKQTANYTEDIKELHIAPMIHASTLEFRLLMRILSRKCVLWTEMVVDETLYFTAARRQSDSLTSADTEIVAETNKENGTDKSAYAVPPHLLDSMIPSGTGLTTVSHPVVCQLGGMRPDWTAEAARLIRQAGYTYELNLNLDCPSSRVQGKRFGAILMKDVVTARELVGAMSENEAVPVSIKCRIGVDDCTDFEWIATLIATLSSSSTLLSGAPCRRFVLHARPVLLQGLSPAQNRAVPPLNYPFVYRLCERFPECTFVINGGISGLRAARELCFGTTVTTTTKDRSTWRKAEAGQAQLPQQGLHGLHSTVPCLECRRSHGSCVAPPLCAPRNLVGTMLGRAALDHPVQFWDVDRYWYGAASNPVSCRRQILDQFCAVLCQLYPRRCCDDHDTIVTDRLPAPTIPATRLYCEYCGSDPQATTSSMSQTAAPHLENGLKQSAIAGRPPHVIKISTRVMDRSLKPVHNLFFSQPGAKAFRRACETLSRDTTIRNCGPAFVLLRAVAATIAPDVLDQPLVRTENLLPGDIVDHTSLQENGLCQD
jgi:tRNA-dihydrouridine synthase A